MTTPRPADRRAPARADHLRPGLMNGARIGIAAQSLGIAEAAYRLARTTPTPAAVRRADRAIPAVAEMVTDMQIDIEAARALTYETSRMCDIENNNLRMLEDRLRRTGQGCEKKRRKARPL
jgi:alkylation response protein AidB-like acyl-CoA dehydrogenase